MTDAPLISVRNLRKCYGEGDSAVEILHGIDLDIHAGEFVAIIGSSGSGKSTLMNILGCLDQPSSGSYRFAGADVAGLDADQLAALRRDAFGFIFQSYHLIGTDTARQNVEIPGIYAGLSQQARSEKATELLTRLGLGERVDHLPGQLSGGQQQRVSIARALMNGGRIILADEPTGALDSRSSAQVMALLRELAEQGHTVVLITHDPEVAQQARRRIEIRDGHVVHDTGPAPSARALPPMPAQTPRINPLTELADAARMAGRALRMNLFRTFLTLLGIVMGVAAVVAMLAVGEGAKHAVLDRINAMGTNLLMVRSEASGRHGADGGAPLVEADAEALSDLPNVAAVMPELTGWVTVRGGGTDLGTQIVGTSASYSRARSWPVTEGAFFTATDEAEHAPVAVLGSTVAQGLFPDGDALGSYVMVNNMPFQVIGVLSEKGATGWGGDADNVMLVPLSAARSRLFGGDRLRSITVAVDDTALMDQTQALVEETLLSRHGQRDFRVRNMADVVEAASQTQNTLTLLLGSVAAISLLVGGIGVMNIMLVSVSERIHEIGIRMATGARTRNILQQFLTEAVTVSALGGVLGVLLGIAAGRIAALFGMDVLFSPATMALAFVCAAGTGLIFGFAPALKAARLNPVAALSKD